MEFDAISRLLYYIFITSLLLVFEWGDEMQFALLQFQVRGVKRVKGAELTDDQISKKNK